MRFPNFNNLKPLKVYKFGFQTVYVKFQGIKYHSAAWWSQVRFVFNNIDSVHKEETKC